MPPRATGVPARSRRLCIESNADCYTGSGLLWRVLKRLERAASRSLERERTGWKEVVRDARKRGGNVDSFVACAQSVEEAAAIGLLRCARMWVDADGLESPMFAARAVSVVDEFCARRRGHAASDEHIRSEFVRKLARISSKRLGTLFGRTLTKPTLSLRSGPPPTPCGTTRYEHSP